MNIIGKKITAVVCRKCKSIINYNIDEVETVQIGNIFANRIKCPKCEHYIEPFYAESVALIKLDEPGKYIKY